MYTLHFINIFGILTPRGIFGLYAVIIRSLGRNKTILDKICYFLWNIICLYQLLFTFGEFLCIDLICLLNYWGICNFDPYRGIFGIYVVIICYLGPNQASQTSWFSWFSWFWPFLSCFPDFVLIFRGCPDFSTLGLSWFLDILILSGG